MLSYQMFKANDIRGTVAGADADGVALTGQPDWDEDGARTLGACYVDLMGLEGESFVLGRDMRLSGPRLSRAFAEGAMLRGARVLDVGLVSTDQLWFASGAMNLPGVQFTASHNPPDYNGIKFCLPGARPVDDEFLAQLRDTALDFSGEVESSPTPGCIETRDTLSDYAAHLHSLVDLTGLRPLTVVVDAGNGMAGHTAGAVLDLPNVDLRGLFLELDGRFPNHQPNPLIPENLRDARQAVKDLGADVGLVFDGDADRCFIIDERGEVVTPSVVTAMIAQAELAREPGATIVINTITSRVVGEVVRDAGGQLVVSRVGHTSVKAHMAEHDAIFGGEHSAHYYFRDFWGADTGMLAALHVLAMRGRSDQPLSELARDYDRYAASGEINRSVADQQACLQAVADAFANRGDIEWGDGVLVTSPADSSLGEWWVNVRPSNTEPLLRVNVEARQADVMAALRDDVLAIIDRTNGEQ